MEKIQPVKGTHDFYGLNAEKMRFVTDVFTSVSELYGYEEMVVPVLEHTELFSRGTGESTDIVRKEMYTFDDKGGRSLSLRPEFTASVVRSILSNKLYATQDLPLKYYYSGPLFRYERPQLGRYREFHQFGVEAIGEDSPLLDSEVILTLVQSLNYLGFKDLVVKINCLGDKESRDNYRKALKAYFEPHLSEMCEDCHARFEINPLRILDCKVPEDQAIVKGAPHLKDYLTEKSQERFKKTLQYLDDNGIKYIIDDNLVRGLDYYSEIVFEVSMSGDLSKYGALAGGGHYASLVSDLGGPDMGGVGFACGLERVVSVLDELHLLDDIQETSDFYLIPVGEIDDRETLLLATLLRSEGYQVNYSYKTQKVGAAFKKAVRKNAKFAVIYGEDELARGVVKVKNLRTEEQVEVSLTPEEDFFATLEKMMEEEHEHEHHHNN